MWPIISQDIEDPNGDDMKMQSAKKKNKNKADEEQHQLIIVKTESELDEGSEVCIHDSGLHIQIKEEPHSREIGKEDSGDSSGHSDFNTNTVTHDEPDDDHHQQEHIKEECESSHVKEEAEAWLKDERDSEEEEGDDREEGSTGR